MSATDWIMLGVIGWGLMTAVVVWWVDGAIKRAPPDLTDPDTRDTILRETLQHPEDEEKAP